MSEWNCDVIRDLLPSYLDGICSDASKKIVDAHLKQCNACRDLVEQMQETAFVSEGAQREEIDYMRKVRRQFANRSRLVFALFAFVLAAGLGILLLHYGDVPMELFYVVQPVLTVSAYLAFSGEWRQAERTRWRWGFGLLGLVVVCYSVVLILLAITWVQADALPFGMQAVDVGPFVYWQLLAGAFVQAVLLLLSVRISTKNGTACPILLDLHITGGCMGLAMNSLLRNMNTLESFRARLFGGVAILLVEGCVVLLLLLFMERRRRKEVL